MLAALLNLYLLYLGARILQRLRCNFSVNPHSAAASTPIAIDKVFSFVSKDARARWEKLKQRDARQRSPKLQRVVVYTIYTKSNPLLQVSPMLYIHNMTI